MRDARAAREATPVAVESDGRAPGEERSPQLPFADAVTDEHQRRSNGTSGTAAAATACRPHGSDRRRRTDPLLDVGRELREIGRAPFFQILSEPDGDVLVTRSPSLFAASGSSEAPLLSPPHMSPSLPYAPLSNAAMFR